MQERHYLLITSHSNQSISHEIYIIMSPGQVVSAVISGSFPAIVSPLVIDLKKCPAGVINVPRFSIDTPWSIALWSLIHGCVGAD